MRGERRTEEEEAEEGGREGRVLGKELQKMDLGKEHAVAPGRGKEGRIENDVKGGLRVKRRYDRWRRGENNGRSR